MVKAKDLLDYICNDLSIRLFSGIVCSGLLPIFNKMDGSFMHYIPTIIEKTAHGIVCGSYLSGIKSSLILDYRLLNSIDFIFNIKNNIPLFIIAYNDGSVQDIESLSNINLSDNYKDDLNRLDKIVFDDLKTGVLVIRDGVLK